MYNTITQCRSCDAKGLVPFFNLGKQPPANSLLKTADQKEDLYPLSLSWCPTCNLVQLNETVDPKELFSSYVWVTGTSKTANEFAKQFSAKLLERAGESKDGYVLEVASNDGTFLVPFMERGMKVLGVDPAKNIADMANDVGVPTMCEFFGEAVADKIVAKEGLAKIIFARNVLPHVANTRDFVNGLAKALADDGTLAIEAHYAKIILEELHYDSIYHEHLCYFTFKSLERLLAEAGLHVFDVDKSPISGGSMVVYAKKNKTPETANVTELRSAEVKDGVNDLAKWQDFAVRSYAHKDKLNAMLQQAKAEGKLIVGWGASARSSTLLNFCGIGTESVAVIIDLNPLKQGLFTAGTHIPIKTAEEGMAMKPQCIFILAWNFEKEIKETLKNKFGYGASYIVPLPNDPRFTA